MFDLSNYVTKSKYETGGAAIEKIVELNPKNVFIFGR